MPWLTSGFLVCPEMILEGIGKIGQKQKYTDPPYDFLVPKADSIKNRERYEREECGREIEFKHKFQSHHLDVKPLSRGMAQQADDASERNEGQRNPCYCQ